MFIRVYKVNRYNFSKYTNKLFLLLILTSLKGFLSKFCATKYTRIMYQILSKIPYNDMVCYKNKFKNSLNYLPRK